MIMTGWDPSSSLSLVFFLKVAKNDNKLFGSLSFSTIFSSIVKDDDEWGGSSSFLDFSLRCKRRRQAEILAHHYF